MNPVCSLTIFGGFDYTDNDTFFTHKLPKLKSVLTLKKTFSINNNNHHHHHNNNKWYHVKVLC